jgi:hypothetical protein
MINASQSEENKRKALIAAKYAAGATTGKLIANKLIGKGKIKSLAGLLGGAFGTLKLTEEIKNRLGRR